MSTKQRAYEIPFTTSLRTGPDDNGQRTAIVSAKSATRARNRLIRELIQIEGTPKIASSIVLAEMLQRAATGCGAPDNMVILMTPEQDEESATPTATDASTPEPAENQEPQAQEQAPEPDQVPEQTPEPEQEAKAADTPVEQTAANAETVTNATTTAPPKKEPVRRSLKG